MPQASDALRAKFPGSDTEAFEVLEPFCTIDKGHIRPKSVEHLARFTQREYDAVDYLFEEWDYGWNTEPAP
jgi:hypothetical protein